MEDDHFEDFTTASEWESFIAKLEGIISEFMAIPEGDGEQEVVFNNWIVVHEKISFADSPFKVSLFKKKSVIVNDESDNQSISKSSPSSLPPSLTLMNSSPSFPPTLAPHVISEYFNLPSFIVLSPSGPIPVENESKLKVLLSSALIALNNVNSPFPIFIQFHHWSLNYFLGVGEHSGVRTSFEMVNLNPRNSSVTPSHLSGLLDLFKSKIGSSLPTPVEICAHFFYTLGDWGEDVNSDSFPPEIFDLLREKKEQLKPTSFLPFGSLDDPFISLELVAGWPCLTEDVVVDSPTYTDLEPENAREWYFSMKQDRNAEFRLTELTNTLWKLKNDKRSIEQVLGKPIEHSKENLDISGALQKITKPSMKVPGIGGIHQVLKQQRRAYYSEGLADYEELAPLSQDQMDLVMDFLFPDAKSTPNFPYLEEDFKFKNEKTNAILENLGGLKSSQIGGLVGRLTNVMAHILTYGHGDVNQGSPSAFAYLWAEFVLELRYRLENSKRICGLDPGSPNIGSCLLNQKLQMLNCCIDKKILWEEKMNSKNNEESDEEDEEEFFDCEEDEEESSSGTGASGGSYKPCGRVKKNGKLRLIKTGEPMYIPDTQDATPLTEDMLEEQSRLMMELGDDAEGSEARAKFMSSSLLSDMESFKAANPGCVLEDFVRWYSPRDWIESGEMDKYGNPLGELSPRMSIQGNLWSEVWSSAKPIPARRQKRLFDDTKEAEKVLHWLSNLTLRDISQLLFPTLVHSALLKVLDEMDSIPGLLDYYELPSTYLSNVVSLTRSFNPSSSGSGTPNHDEEINSYRNHVIQDLQVCERELSEVKSFMLKFPNEFEDILKNEGGVKGLAGFIKIADGKRSPLGGRIMALFESKRGDDILTEDNSNYGQPRDNVNTRNNNNNKFGQPIKRVFVLKYCPPTNGRVDSNNDYLSLPQRMSCLLRDDKFLLAGTFSTRTSLV